MSDNRNDFENQLVRTFKNHLGREGRAFRKRQHKFANQEWDVMALRRVHLELGPATQALAIEAKSKDINEETPKAYFSKNFKGREQLDVFKSFCKDSGVAPFIAVEGRQHGGSIAYILHLEDVIEMYENGAKGIPLIEEEVDEDLPENVIELERVPTKKQEKENLPK